MPLTNDAANEGYKATENRKVRNDIATSWSLNSEKIQYAIILSQEFLLFSPQLVTFTTRTKHTKYYNYISIIIYFSDVLKLSWLIFILKFNKIYSRLRERCLQRLKTQFFWKQIIDTTISMTLHRSIGMIGVNRIVH